MGYEKLPKNDNALNQPDGEYKGTKNSCGCYIVKLLFVISL
jgi:hypothetical protein